MIVSPILIGFGFLLFFPKEVLFLYVCLRCMRCSALIFENNYESVTVENLFYEGAIHFEVMQIYRQGPIFFIAFSNNFLVTYCRYDNFLSFLTILVTAFIRN